MNKKNFLYLGGLVLSCFSFISNFYFKQDSKNTKKFLTYKKAFEISLDSLVSGKMNYKINADHFADKLSGYGLNKDSLLDIVNDSYEKGCRKEFDEAIVFIENGYFKYMGRDYELRARKIAEGLGFNESMIEKSLKKGSAKRYNILIDELGLKLYNNNAFDFTSLKETDLLIGETEELIRRFDLPEYRLNYFVLDGLIDKQYYPILYEIKEGNLEHYNYITGILDILDKYCYKNSSFYRWTLKKTLKNIYPELSDKDKERIDIRNNS